MTKITKQKIKLPISEMVGVASEVELNVVEDDKADKHKMKGGKMIMEIPIKNYKTKGAIREINKKIEDIIDGESFMSEITTIGDYPEKRSFIKIPKGKEIIMLAKALIEVVEDYYKED